eukprot:g1163.t1
MRQKKQSDEEIRRLNENDLVDDVGIFVAEEDSTIREIAKCLGMRSARYLLKLNVHLYKHLSLDAQLVGGTLLRVLDTAPMIPIVVAGGDASTKFWKEIDDYVRPVETSKIVSVRNQFEAQFDLRSSDLSMFAGTGVMESDGWTRTSFRGYSENDFSDVWQCHDPWYDIQTINSIRRSGYCRETTFRTPQRSKKKYWKDKSVSLVVSDAASLFAINKVNTTHFQSPKDFENALRRKNEFIIMARRFDGRVSTLETRKQRLLSLMDALERIDKRGIFKRSVMETHPEIWTRYKACVRTPMDFTTMRRRINDAYDTREGFETRLYDIEDVRHDLYLICSNCMNFNPEGTVVHNAAQRLLQTGFKYVDRVAAGWYVDGESGFEEKRCERVGQDVGFVHYYVQWFRGDDGKPPEQVVYITTLQATKHRTHGGEKSDVFSERYTGVSLLTLALEHARRVGAKRCYLDATDDSVPFYERYFGMRKADRISDSRYQPMVLQLAQKPELRGWQSLYTLGLLPHFKRAIRALVRVTFAKEQEIAPPAVVHQSVNGSRVTFCLREEVKGDQPRRLALATANGACEDESAIAKYQAAVASLTFEGYEETSVVRQCEWERRAASRESINIESESDDLLWTEVVSLQRELAQCRTENCEKESHLEKAIASWNERFPSLEEETKRMEEYKAKKEAERQAREHERRAVEAELERERREIEAALKRELAEAKRAYLRQAKLAINTASSSSSASSSTLTKRGLRFVWIPRETVTTAPPPMRVRLRRVRVKTTKYAAVSATSRVPTLVNEDVVLQTTTSTTTADKTLYCVCRQPWSEDSESMFMCEGPGSCGDWFHLKCLGLRPCETRSDCVVDASGMHWDTKQCFRCSACRKRNPLPASCCNDESDHRFCSKSTTMKRKRSSTKASGVARTPSPTKANLCKSESTLSGRRVRKVNYRAMAAGLEQDADVSEDNVRAEATTEKDDANVSSQWRSDTVRCDSTPPQSDSDLVSPGDPSLSPSRKRLRKQPLDLNKVAPDLRGTVVDRNRQLPTHSPSSVSEIKSCSLSGVLKPSQSMNRKDEERARAGATTTKKKQGSTSNVFSLLRMGQTAYWRTRDSKKMKKTTKKKINSGQSRLSLKGSRVWKPVLARSGSGDGGP